MTIKRIALTGGLGNIAYNLLFRIANGELFGKNVPIALNILEVPEKCDAFEAMTMELEDCSFPLLQDMRIGSDPYEMFADADLALLIGSKPRLLGMERKDLLLENGKIFAEQGKALNAVASKDAVVFVVGNPCNTNCLIAMHQAPNLQRKNFYAMTRLDENRARFQLAKKANVSVDRVDRIVVWGNHSTTQVPDFLNASIDGQRVESVIQDRQWLEQTFFDIVQKRGAAVIKARKTSSAASAAQAILDGVRSIYFDGPIFSCGKLSTGNPYNIKHELIFSFPCCREKGDVKIMEGFKQDPFFEHKLQLTERELIEEREMILHLLHPKKN